jgi:hypothetical protein
MNKANPEMTPNEIGRVLNVNPSWLQRDALAANVKLKRSPEKLCQRFRDEIHELRVKRGMSEVSIAAELKRRHPNEATPKKSAIGMFCTAKGWRRGNAEVVVGNVDRRGGSRC